MKPAGSFIHAFAATTETVPPMPAMTIGTPVQKCAHGLQPLPAVDVDGDEDRLGEEEQALDRERDAERVAPLAHELRPEQAELELSTVPVTAPTAKVTAMYFDQRCASSSASRRPS